MNATTKHDTRPTTAALHADAMGVAAYKAARALGATRDQAMAAYLSAYADAIRQG